MLERVDENLLLVGTAHVSAQSVREVEQAIEDFAPDVVCVELDERRLETLENKRKWEQTPIHDFLKGDKVWLFLTQVILASYQRRMGRQLGIEPGAEMLAAVRDARQTGAEVVLADRDIGITMRRAHRRMGFWEKTKLSWQITRAIIGGEEEEEVDVEELLKEDVLTRMMTELGELAPSIKEVVLDERDTFLAEKIRREHAAGRKVLAVVGAGHLSGIKKKVTPPAAPVALSGLEEVPDKRFGVAKLIGWGFPLGLIALLLYFAWLGFQEGNYTKLIDSATALFLWGGGLAALGALLARGHPYSIATAFVTAPLGILHPGLATGWFSGFVEAWRRTPVVKDFEGLANIETSRDFWGNRVIRVVLVAAFTNLGAMVGGFIAAGKILSNLDII